MSQHTMHFLTHLKSDRSTTDREFHNILLDNKNKESQVRKFSFLILLIMSQFFEICYTKAIIEQLTSKLHLQNHHC